MMIIEEFRKNKKRLVPRRPSKGRRWDAQRQQHIEGWLAFCGAKYRLIRISQVRQKHYTDYMRYLSSRGLAAATIYNHALTINEFIERAHLQIRANPGRAYRRRQEREKLGSAN